MRSVVVLLVTIVLPGCAGVVATSEGIYAGVGIPIGSPPPAARKPEPVSCNGDSPLFPPHETR